MLALPTLLVAMDLTVLHLAVPQLSADLQPSSAQLLWIVDIYGFLVAGSLITMGTLGDRIGRRRLLLAGAATFGAASVIAAFANSAGMLIATRALLGVAGATLLPSTLALIRHMFVDPKQRGLAIGVWAAVFSAGTALGPVLGGALLERFWWGSVFLIAVPAMLALLLLGPVVLPEYRDPGAGRLDLVSAALSLVGVLAVIYGLKQIAEHGAGPLSVLSISAGFAVSVLFVLRQRVLADPLIDLRLFGRPRSARPSRPRPLPCLRGRGRTSSWPSTYSSSRACRPWRQECGCSPRRAEALSGRCSPRCSQPEPIRPSWCRPVSWSPRGASLC